MPRELIEDTVQDTPLETGMAVCGEYLVPGGSHLVQGDLKGAAIHGALGLAASMLFGFPLRLLVSANSLRTALSRPVIAPKTEAEDAPAVEATDTPAVEPAETAVAKTPVVDASNEAPEPVVAVTEPPPPPARRSTPPRKTAVKKQAKAAAPALKPAATPKKTARARSPKSTT
jgi:hypothetical protein